MNLVISAGSGSRPYFSLNAPQELKQIPLYLFVVAGESHFKKGFHRRSLTSNLKRAAVPGNVLLAARESGLPKASVVLVSQLFTVDKSDLMDDIGTLSKTRVRQILNGIHLVIEPREPSKNQHVVILKLDGE